MNVSVQRVQTDKHFDKDVKEAKIGPNALKEMEGQDNNKLRLISKCCADY